MKINCLTSVLFLLISFAVAGQHRSVDSLHGRDMDSVVFTATRTERKLSNVAIPTTLVSQKTIRQSGSLRLKDILQEQTGLFLSGGFGAGVQMQGLGADYTLILLDGEPLIGRTAGILDLNRITVGNIRKIEIVKGPSSSLYGSEALAGVINIITDRSFDKKLSLGFRYGTYNTMDATVNASTRIGKTGINTFLNSYSTNGYSLRPFSVERASLPVWRGTAQMQFHQNISERTQVSVSARFNNEIITNELTVTNNGQLITSKGREVNKDVNISPVISHRISDRLSSSLRFYGTFFEGHQELDVAGGQGYNDIFRQQFYRVENQTDYTIRKNLSFVGGAGHISEFVNSTRYDDVANQKRNRVVYGFIQSEWLPVEKVTLITGIRYDNNNLYASAFSPKVALRIKANDRLRFQASFGKGFKAPDFRQLYLNFTNTAAGSYSVFGALEARRIIDLLNQHGLVMEFEPDYYRLQDLKPEFSSGWNGGFHAIPVKNLEWQVNVFRNDITNLIESRQVATRVDNTQIFSYINVKKAYTQGIENNIYLKISKSISLSGGYQFLMTGDKNEIREIRNGNYYTRDENNNSVKLNRSDYYGLPNRSRHMANMKWLYENVENNWFVNARWIYRSKWVVFDKDGNGIYNRQDEFASEFVMFNISGGKSFSKGFRIQAGIDNILNYVDGDNLPNMPGRSFYAAINYSITKKQTTK